MAGFRPARLVRFVAVSAVFGLSISWIAAWALAFAFPANHLDIFGREQEGQYLVPQFRERTPLGDVYVDESATWNRTRCDVAATWLFRSVPAWHATTYPYPEDVPDWALAQHGPPPWVLPGWAARHDVATIDRNIETWAWGWPFRALCGEVRTTPHYDAAGKMDGIITVHRFFWTRPTGFPGSPGAKLPLRPVWAGVLGDTAFYGFLVSAAVLVFGWIRVARRRRRGLCSGCAYDRRGLASGTPCPECGRV